ncbi:MAG: S-methyl-5'-thioinosine phosphorylase [Austwickia sp.]|jgi:5'-deoxy-5'-methylthioadenosine phosphorylase|nr:MAG: S-methyl-5'-thioinosine phosphorylase [Austwickia sp.]
MDNTSGDGQIAPVGIIAGTGFYSLAQLLDARERDIDTPYGVARVTEGTWHGLPVAFLTRHGAGHAVPPHLVNYRANIAGLKAAGVREIIAVNAVGSIDPGLAVGDLVLIDDFLDFTKGRETTFFDGATPDGVVHVDVTTAYHPDLRRELLQAAADCGQPLRDGGVYAAFEGPRFESPAEVRMAGLLGGSVAGMTGVPEVTLAVEAGLRYAAVALVCNPCAGLTDEPVSIVEVGRVLADTSQRVLAVLDRFLLRRGAAE